MSIEVTSSGLYGEVEADRTGLPEAVNRFPDDVIPPDVTHFVLYLRLTGDQGLYNLSTNIKAFHEHPEFSVGMGDLSVAINKPGSSAHVRIPWDVRLWPIGRYRVTFALNGEFLAELWWHLGH